ncbi:DUF420 domain-containing protein [Bacillus solimangrovi]|uniref:DUF420 domain-containing protein n=1 Tax=Bacillus solimangrovi TaxID=1305675 RepID=A0A1E5LIW0_9BACI|nr:DUF420 domain-containing protein [Bacillus solimangrovi]OEH94001.1 hypothetical protein BFG57_10165 [Bacillus solimangrovi]
MEQQHTVKQRNFTPIIVILTIAINSLVAILFFMPKYNGLGDVDLTFLPFLNAVMNSFTFVFLVAALVSIKKKNIKSHTRFVFAALSTTAIFLVSYVTYHALAESTHFGGEGVIKYVYYFILISHILLSIVIVPLVLTSVARGINKQTEKHRKIAKITMPMWLYVSMTGVLVYLMISPYY